MKQWQTPTLVEANTGTASLPQVAMDPLGNAVVVWAQSDGTRDNIWANRYDNMTGWGTPGLIEANDFAAEYPAVAIDANGNAIAVWEQSDGTRTNIWAVTYR